MTVKDLIALLSEAPGDMEVVVEHLDCDGGGHYTEEPFLRVIHGEVVIS